MTIDNINLEDVVKQAKEAMEKEKLSPSMKAIMNIMLTVISLLANRLGMNSKNSSTPPSKDLNREKRKKSNGKKQGGQKGHIGKTLKQIDTPDEIEEIKIDRRTLPKGKYTQAGYEKRQVFDLDISVIVKEYQAEIIEDEKGKRFTAAFPKGVTNSVQYGSGVKAHAVYLSQYQLLPYKRIEEYFEDQIGLPLSAGTICNFNQKAYEKLNSFDSFVKKKLIASEVLHADETGINIDGNRLWVHVHSNENWTYLFPHKKRGQEAMNEIEILQYYKGTLCHDHWKPYYKYKNMSHALCNAHHIRELERVWEQDKQEWGRKMKELLYKINQEVDNAGGKLEHNISNKWKEQYRKILTEAEIECPPPKTPEQKFNEKKKRGRLKRSKARNLLERLRDFEDDVLRFMDDSNIPFTNNLGERDIRMLKVQQKISGCFRSFDGAKIFCLIRSYISSAKKNNHTASYALRNLFDSKNIFE